MVSDFDDAPTEVRPPEAIISSVSDIFSNLINSASQTIQNQSRPFSRPFIQAKMFNQQMKMLYDSGADISAINETIFRKIPIDLRPPQLKDSLFKSSNQQVDNICKSEANTCYQSTWARRRFIILSTSSRT